MSALDSRLPAVARALRDAADRLEHHERDLCDIEFTIERGRLWMLQVRIGKRSPQAALRMAVDMATEPDFPLDRREALERVARILEDPPTTTTDRGGDLIPLTMGLGASPGLATGEIATEPSVAAEAGDAGRAVILVRAETSPNDVHGMAKSVGILTARGGLASHAAVVARGWGIPAVVGAAGVTLGDGSVQVGDRRLDVGAVISIDGSTGEVFLGRVPDSSEPAPEAKTLLAWAAELGVPIGAGARRRSQRSLLAGRRSTTSSGASRRRGSGPRQRLPMRCSRRRTRSPRCWISSSSTEWPPRWPAPTG